MCENFTIYWSQINKLFVYFFFKKYFGKHETLLFIFIFILREIFKLMLGKNKMIKLFISKCFSHFLVPNAMKMFYFFFKFIAIKPRDDKFLRWHNEVGFFLLISFFFPQISWDFRTFFNHHSWVLGTHNSIMTISLN